MGTFLAFARPADTGEPPSLFEGHDESSPLLSISSLRDDYRVDDQRVRPQTLTSPIDKNGHGTPMRKMIFAINITRVFRSGCVALRYLNR